MMKYYTKNGTEVIPLGPDGAFGPSYDSHGNVDAKGSYAMMQLTPIVPQRISLVNTSNLELRRAIAASKLEEA